jgi:hypothetical protein
MKGIYRDKRIGSTYIAAPTQCVYIYGQGGAIPYIEELQKEGG